MPARIDARVFVLLNISENGIDKGSRVIIAVSIRENHRLRNGNLDRHSRIEQQFETAIENGEVEQRLTIQRPPAKILRDNVVEDFLFSMTPSTRKSKYSRSLIYDGMKKETCP